MIFTFDINYLFLFTGILLILVNLHLFLLCDVRLIALTLLDYLCNAVLNISVHTCSYVLRLSYARRRAVLCQHSYMRTSSCAFIFVRAYISWLCKRGELT